VPVAAGDEAGVAVALSMTEASPETSDTETATPTIVIATRDRKGSAMTGSSSKPTRDGR
jgi:hypothetical protein